MQISLIQYDSSDKSHAKKFADLNREWLSKYFRVEDHDEKVLSAPENYIISKGGVILFAKTSDTIVGTGCLTPLEDGYYEIAKMAVTKGYQGKGIGEQIFLALLHEANLRKLSKLFIVSNTSLERAIRLYRKHGFVESAENRHSHYERGDITLELVLKS